MIVTSALYATSPSTREILRVRVRRVASEATEIECGALRDARFVASTSSRSADRIRRIASSRRVFFSAVDLVTRRNRRARRGYVALCLPLRLFPAKMRARRVASATVGSFHIDRHRHLELAEVKRSDEDARAKNARKRSVSPLIAYPEP